MAAQENGGQPAPAASAPAAPPPQPLFLSGSHHREACFGQEVVSAPVMLADLKQKRKLAEEKAAAEAKGLPPVGKPKRTGKGSNVTLKELIDGGFLKPGTGTVTVTYKGTLYRADLLATGQIQFNGQTFDAPSSFSVHAKRLLNPSKQGDDGWHSVHVDGTVLDDYRARLLAQREAAAGGGEAKTEDGAVKTEPGAEGTTVKSEGGDAGPSAVKKEEGGDGSVEVKTEQDSKDAIDDSPESIYLHQLPAGELPPLPSSFDVQLPEEPAPEEEVVEEGEPDTANWVQCTRCQAWRVVPDEFWPDIEASQEEDWFCEEATWDLTQFDPFTPACKEFKK